MIEEYRVEIEITIVESSEMSKRFSEEAESRLVCREAQRK